MLPAEQRLAAELLVPIRRGQVSRWRQHGHGQASSAAPLAQPFHLFSPFRTNKRLYGRREQFYRRVLYHA